MIAAWNDPGLVRWVSSLVVVVRNADGCVLGVPYRVGVVRKAGNGFGTFRTVPRAVGSCVGVGIPGFLLPEGGRGTVRNPVEGL